MQAATQPLPDLVLGSLRAPFPPFGFISFTFFIPTFPPWCLSCGQMAALGLKPHRQQVQRRELVAESQPGWSSISLSVCKVGTAVYTTEARLSALAEETWAPSGGAEPRAGCLA